MIVAGRLPLHTVPAKAALRESVTGTDSQASGDVNSDEVYVALSVKWQSSEMPAVPKIT